MECNLSTVLAVVFALTTVVTAHGEHAMHLSGSSFWSDSRLTTDCHKALSWRAPAHAVLVTPLLAYTVPSCEAHIGVVHCLQAAIIAYPCL